MIPELILTCAMSLPGISFPNNEDISILRMLSSFYLREAYDDLHDTANKRHTTPKVVVVSDRWNLVDPLRGVGIQAWQISRFAGISGWWVQGNIELLPIREKAIHVVWVLEPVTDVNPLYQLTFMVRELGFLIVELPEGGDLLLRASGFEKSLFKWNDHQIWRRSSA